MEDRIIEWLAAASYPDLVRVVHEGLRLRPDAAEDSTAHQYLLGIAQATRTEGKWELDLSALPDASQYPKGVPHGEPWCQFAECSKCTLTLTSATKWAICPACGTSNYFT
jgi:hypothetical protein